MTKGFPCLAFSFLSVLVLQHVHANIHISSPSQENLIATTQPTNSASVNESSQSKNGSETQTDLDQSSTSLDSVESTNGKTESLNPANQLQRYIVDTSDVDLNHDDCISGDAEIGEFAGRVAEALQDWTNSNWRAFGITKRADVNGDGKICWCDFITIYLKDKVLGLKHEFPFVVVPDDVMFVQLDSNKDGKLEGKERDGLLEQFASCMTPKQARSIINAMSLMSDLDKSISIQEYRRFFARPVSSYRMNQIARQQDLQQQQQQNQQSQHHNQQQQQQQLQQQQQQHQEEKRQPEVSQWQQELRRLQQQRGIPSKQHPQRQQQAKISQPTMSKSTDMKPLQPQHQQPQFMPNQQIQQQRLIQNVQNGHLPVYYHLLRRQQLLNMINMARGSSSQKHPQDVAFAAPTPPKIPKQNLPQAAQQTNEKSRAPNHIPTTINLEKTPQRLQHQQLQQTKAESQKQGSEVTENHKS